MRALSRSELEHFFFPDEADQGLMEGKRRTRNRLGFMVRLCIMRCLGASQDDPADVPAEVVDYPAEQLGIADPSVLQAYGDREKTRLGHVRELWKLLGAGSPPRRRSRCGRGWTRRPGRS